MYYVDWAICSDGALNIGDTVYKVLHAIVSSLGAMSHIDYRADI